MQRVDVAKAEVEFDEADPEGFRSGMLRFGPKLGAARTGASIYELPPGQSICPYHYELGEEEWLLVLEGTVTLRTPEGTEPLEQFEIVFFEPGPGGAHQVRNDTDKTVRVLMWSELVHPAVSVYPDSDKIGVFTGDKSQNVIVERSSNVDYFHGEV